MVIGIDLSPIQPINAPSNCHFRIDDLDLNWQYSSPFDYIHTRAMVASIRDWNRFFEQAYAHLKPGGYLELQEIAFPARCTDSSLTAVDSALLAWSNLFIDAARRTGLDVTAPSHLFGRLRGAGFVDIQVKICKWPLGTWSKGEILKRLGEFAYSNLLDWLKSSSLALFTRELGWSLERVEVFLMQCREDMERHKTRHFYANM